MRPYKISAALALAVLFLRLCTGCSVSVGAMVPIPLVETPEETYVSEQKEEPLWTSWEYVPVFAHAMGSVDGRTETNSLDAFLESYEAGHRVFEVDLQLTADGGLVARHDWDQISYYNLEQKYAGVMDRQTFMDTPICFFYSPLDVDGIVGLLRDYPDIWIMTDSKALDEVTIRLEMECLSRAITRTGDPSLWDRIIVQIYHEDMFHWISGSFPVKNWIYTLYQQVNPDYEQVGRFCEENGIRVITFVDSRLSQEHVRILHSHGCRVYVHTINKLRAMLEMSWGADGYYSDLVSPTQYLAVKNGESGMILKK